MRYLMTFSYDGSEYNGYQKQINMKTVQNEIESALKKINGNQTISIHASGRTDAGVHAWNQKAHFDMEKNIQVDRLRHSLNCLLTGSIYVKKIEEVSRNFHARFDVVSKEYHYQLNMGEYNPIEKDYVCQWNHELDLEEMKEALQTLVGEHDFQSFTKAGDLHEDYVRTIYKAELQMNSFNHITFVFIGSGFLRYQIRNMVGTLLEIGEGKRKAKEMKEILEAKDRRKAGITAPACGLYLKDVYYNEAKMHEK